MQNLGIFAGNLTPILTRKGLIILTNDFETGSGGISSLCHTLAGGLISHFSKVVVIAKTEIVHNGQNNTPYRLLAFSGNRVGFMKHALTWLFQLKKEEDWLVLCAHWHYEATLALLAGYHRVFVLAHGKEVLPGRGFFRRKIGMGLYAKQVFKRVKTIANSGFTEKMVKNIYPKAVIKTLLPGVDENYFIPQPKTLEESKKLVIGSAGRILKQKGYANIVRALDRLPDHLVEKWEWHLAGEGEFLNELKEMVRNRKWAKNVNFKGKLTGDEMLRFYQSLHLFVLLPESQLDKRISEGFGLVFIEAQACGVPVVGSFTGGIPEAVEPGMGGWLINATDDAALADLVSRLITDRKQLFAQQKKARERILRHFSRVGYQQELLNFLNENTEILKPTAP